MDVLDTEPEEAFDQIVTLMRTIFGVETAYISLVDSDRQWFKARSGLDATETPRDIAFCAHAILKDELLVVPDATRDARFRSNPLVTGDPKIRFYAGAPLRTDDGHALGTLCMTDPVPRDGLGARDREILSELASVVVRLLDERRQRSQAGERLLVESESQAQRTANMLEIMECMSQGAMMMDGHGVCRYASSRALELLGLPEGRLVEGMDVGPLLLAAVERGALAERMAADYYAAQGQGGEAGFHIDLPNGEVVRCDVRGRVEGGCIVTLSDVTEERKRKEGLQRSKEELRLMLDHIPALVFHKDSENRLLQVNAAAAVSLEMPLEEVEGLSCYELYEDEIAAKYHADDLEVIRSGQPKLGIVEPYLPVSGAPGWVSTDKVPYTDPATGEQHVFVVATDITAQRQAEEDARTQLARLEAVYNSAPALMHTLDPRGRITSVSDFWLEVMGYEREEVLGKNFRAFLCEGSDNPFSPRKLDRFKQTGILKDDAIRLVRADGEPVDVLASSVPEYRADGSVDRVISVLTDITERLRTERKLLQSQKMESVGQLTSGLAHDFNNLLGVIVGNIQLMERSLDDPKARKRAAAVLSAAESGADLTRRLLAFSRRREIDVSAMDAAAALTEFDGMVRRLLGETVSVQTCLTDALPPIVADASQLESAILNLCVNARDAMPDGGDLTLEARTVGIHSEEAESEGVAPGNFVKISVTDTGEGMDRATLDKVLEPFFSTKAAGLGLVQGQAEAVAADSAKERASLAQQLNQATAAQAALPPPGDPVALGQLELKLELKQGAHLELGHAQGAGAEVAVALTDVGDVGVPDLHRGRAHVEGSVAHRRRPGLVLLGAGETRPGASSGELSGRLVLLLQPHPGVHFRRRRHPSCFRLHSPLILSTFMTFEDAPRGLRSAPSLWHGERE
ncbi:MAG: PAS domain-containing protein [Pseudomonadota bacterium]